MYKLLMKGLLVTVFALLPLGVGGLMASEPQMKSAVTVEKAHWGGHGWGGHGWGARGWGWRGGYSYYYPYYYNYNYPYYYYPYNYNYYWY